MPILSFSNLLVALNTSLQPYTKSEDFEKCASYTASQICWPLCRVVFSKIAVQKTKVMVKHPFWSYVSVKLKVYVYPTTLLKNYSQPAFTCSTSTTGTLDKDVKYVQS